jgi:hypothetical protein
MVTQETQGFLIGLGFSEENSPTSCVLVFLMVIGVVVVVCQTCPDL